MPERTLFLPKGPRFRRADGRPFSVRPPAVRGARREASPPPCSVSQLGRSLGRGTCCHLRVSHWPQLLSYPVTLPSLPTPGSKPTPYCHLRG